MPRRSGRAWPPAARRGAWLAGAAAVLWFAIEGGEYGTTDLLRQRGRFVRDSQEVEALRAEVDSLEAELRIIRTDPARLEQVAREEHGMVRGDKEIVYMIRRAGADGDSAVTDSTGPLP